MTNDENRARLEATASALETVISHPGRDTMRDIVERLEAVDTDYEHDCWMNAPLFKEAAAEIIRLRTAELNMRERAAQAAEQQAEEFLSPEYATNQPLSSLRERLACAQIAEAIRALEPSP